MTFEMIGTDWVKNIKTIEDVKDVISTGEELAARYHGYEAFIGRCGFGYCVDVDGQSGIESSYDDIDEFCEKATIDGDLLRDVVDQIEFF